MKLTIRPIERKAASDARVTAAPPPERMSRPLSSYADRELLGQSSGASHPEGPPAAFFPVTFTTAPQPEPIGIDSDFRTGDSFVEELPEHSTEGGDAASEQEPEDASEPVWKRSRWPALILMLALLTFGTIWYFASRSDRTLILARVQVSGDSLLSTREVLALANIDHKIPFYSIDLKPIEARLLRHSLIRVASVAREVDPPTLVITIRERQPIALLRSDSTDEAFIVDHDGGLLRPKLLAGLRNPRQFLQVPLLSGVSERDTAGYQAMARLVTMIGALDSGALRGSIGELHRTPTGDYVIYTSETQTPLFIGSPFAQAFHTSLEEQIGTLPAYPEPLFNRQLQLLAHAWKTGLKERVLAGGVLYVDARFSGQLVLKQASTIGTNAPTHRAASVLQLGTNNAHYATNAIPIQHGSRTNH